MYYSYWFIHTVRKFLKNWYIGEFPRQNSGARVLPVLSPKRMFIRMAADQIDSPWVEIQGFTGLVVVNTLYVITDVVIGI